MSLCEQLADIGKVVMQSWDRLLRSVVVAHAVEQRRGLVHEHQRTTMLPGSMLRASAVLLAVVPKPSGTSVIEYTT